MKPLKPDSLLPFAIAAILGFLVLGLNGGERQSPPREPNSVESIPVDKRKTLRDSPDLHVQMNSLPARVKHE